MHGMIYETTPVHQLFTNPSIGQYKVLMPSENYFWQIVSSVTCVLYYKG
jgi:hypothetical protein